jgi:hypothetical protein
LEQAIAPPGKECCDSIGVDLRRKVVLTGSDLQQQFVERRANAVVRVKEEISSWVVVCRRGISGKGKWT